MTPYLCCFLCWVGDSTSDERPRHPLAPSMPMITKEEAAQYEKIIDRFILYDIGKLPGAAGKKALEDFKALPPESIFVLMDGFNRAAAMEHSCPAVLIGKRISSILNASNDLELLAFAKENIGAGVTAKRHQGLMKDMQFGIQLRKGAVQRHVALMAANPAYAAKAYVSMPLPELVKVTEKAKGPHLVAALSEIEKRKGDKVFETLAIAAGSRDKELHDLGAGLLAKHMTRQTPQKLKELLRHTRSEVKAATAKEVGTRELRYGDELSVLIGDSDPAVHQAARAALVRISGGMDFGPLADASFGDRDTARKRWQEWWQAESKK